jgi:dTDP-4-dehydrorhamnose reductase
MRVLILGVTGMFGNALYKIFTTDQQHEVWGTLRSASGKKYFPVDGHDRLIDSVDVTDQDTLAAVLNRARPDVVINAVGVIKQLATAEDPLIVMPINAMLPHRLAALCSLAGARMIQISTDCVFSGRAGNYSESDLSDAEDLYGKSKYIGEVHDQPHVITLRTSGIGHELNSRNGLLEWFLAQQGQVKGFSKAIYSGLPWVELARVIKDVVLPRPEMSGLYHVSSKPISKLDLLHLVAEVYEKDIKIIPDDALWIDRSLNSARFTAATGYVAAEWPELIAQMHEYRPGAAGLANVR